MATCSKCESEVENVCPECNACTNCAPEGHSHDEKEAPAGGEEHESHHEGGEHHHGKEGHEHSEKHDESK